MSKTSNENLAGAYEKEVEKLTKEEQILESQVKVLRSSRPEFGTALDITFNFLKNPYAYWKNGDLKAKHLVLKLVFNDRIVYHRGIGLGTAHLSLPLRVFKLTELGNSCDVDPTGLEPATPSVQMRCSTR